VPDSPSRDAWFRRVQALLAKAESTAYPAEAEALLAKAQQLMARHAIDEAMLAANGTRRDEVTTSVLLVEPPYANPKAVLLSAVADANGCRVVVHGRAEGARRCVIVGHASDLAGVEALFAALSLHATRELLAAPVPPWDAPRRFRHAFLLAFASRIGERLREAARAAQAGVADGAGAGASVALALVDRGAAVDAALQAEFPTLRTSRSSASSTAGVAGGRAAADGAPLGHSSVGGSRRAL